MYTTRYIPTSGVDRKSKVKITESENFFIAESIYRPSFPCHKVDETKLFVPTLIPCHTCHLFVYPL